MSYVENGPSSVNPINANLEMLRSRMSEGWEVESLVMRFAAASSWRTTVTLKRKQRDLILQSDDRELFEFCIAMRQSLDSGGNPAFRRFADLNRYYADVEHLTEDSERKRKEAVQRLISSQMKLDFAPETLIADFLKSRNWGDSRYISLKERYFDIIAVVLFSSKAAAEAQERLQQKVPESIVYAKRMGEALLKTFRHSVDPVRSYLRFSDVSKSDFPYIAGKLLAEARFNSDIFARLSVNGGRVDGEVGLRFLIDMYRRYLDWAFPLLRVLSEAVCTVDGSPLPEPGIGLTKRVEVIRQSSFSDIVNCVDPRIRHAASHNGFAFDQDRGMVTFCGLDSDGNRKFEDFELTYVQVSDNTRDFIRGFIPGLLIAFGMQQQVLLLSAVMSGEFLNLLLLIGNELAA